MLKEFGSADIEVDWDQLEDSLRQTVLKDSLHAERRSNELFDGQGAQRLTNLILQHLTEAREPTLDHLFIFSHPGNEVQLAGGTISRLSARGERVGVVLVGDGLSSRQSSSRFARERATQQLALECAVHESQEALGVYSSYWLRNPDNDLSRVSLPRLGGALAVILERHKPGVIWTHGTGELNSDYDIVVRAVQVAAREGAHTRFGVLGCPSSMSSSWAIAPMALRPQVRVPLDAGDISRAQGAYAAYARTGYWRQRPESWESWETARRFAAISSPDDWAEVFFAYEIRLPALSSSLGPMA
jgi:LmbE family N-acetylglucosaminyl deacetylase